MTTDVMLESLTMKGLDTLKEADKKYYGARATLNEQFKMNYQKLLNLTTMSLKMYSTSYYKSAPFLELSDVEQIKSALTNYVGKDEKLMSFKQELISDLGEFQKKIELNHIEKMSSLIIQKQNIEILIKRLNISKAQFRKNKLASLFGHNRKKMKEHDIRIEALKTQYQKCLQKISKLEQEHPSANEKDILIYQMSLKEKYAKKVKLLVY